MAGAALSLLLHTPLHQGRGQSCRGCTQSAGAEGGGTGDQGSARGGFRGDRGNLRDIYGKMRRRNCSGQASLKTEAVRDREVAEAVTPRRRLEEPLQDPDRTLCRAGMCLENGKDPRSHQPSE